LINKKNNNFDLLRLLLATIVAIVHAGQLSGNIHINTISQHFNSGLAVDSFFIVSGFLIFMSYESSSSISTYFNKRIRRILPGYLFVITFFSIILYFTSICTFKEYFNLEFLKYILANFLTLNFIQSTLPGVFETNNVHAVNGALWTIKIEIMFYISIPFIVYFIKKIKHKYIILVSIYILSILYSIVMLHLYNKDNNLLFLQLEKQLLGQFAFFISGAMLFYYFKYFQRYSLLLLIGAIFILILHRYYINIYFLYPISLAIIILYFATVFKYLGNFGRYGDLSFGIYIWHFPILQIFIYYNLFSNLAFSIPFLICIILFMSYLSWHLIEKRYLFSSSYYIKSNP